MESKDSGKAMRFNLKLSVQNNPNQVFNPIQCFSIRGLNDSKWKSWTEFDWEFYLVQVGLIVIRFTSIEMEYLFRICME